MTETQNKFISFLKENGLKPTTQRNLVVKQLLNGKDRHFTAEDLYDEMKLKKKNISLATIYNTVEAFKKAGKELELLEVGSSLTV